MENDIILIGAFGEMCELAEICGKKIVGIIDNNLNDTFRGIPIIGKDEDAPILFKKFFSIPVVVTPDKPQIRKKLVEYYRRIGYKFSTLISPLAYISPSAEIGNGTVIQSFCNVSSNSTIGDFCKLNTFSNVMHDNIIGDFTTIAPSAVLLGRVEIGEKAYIGANATILPGTKVGADVIVGAGSVVTKNIPSNTIVKGVPAK